MNLFKKINFTLLVVYTCTTHTHITHEQLKELASYAIQHDQLPQALELYTRIIRLDPSDAMTHYNCGYVHTRLNNNNDAIACYTQTINLAPDYTQAKLGLSKALLACGKFKQAWPLFEHRLAQLKLVHQAFGYVNLLPSSCSGKKVLIRAEWGLGDMVHFVRYAKLLHDFGSYVIVQTFEPLIPLFSLCSYIDRVISIHDPIPTSDIQIPMLSLPMIFKTTVETIPIPIPYLTAQHELVEQWKFKLAQDAAYKIGICWHAKPIYLEDHITTRRSIPLACFEPLTQLPISMYSLQKEFGMEEAASLPLLKPIPADFDESHGRFMDTAALIMNLDLVISADTSIVHIAGALGKEVWVLLPYAPEWRWLPGVDGYETKTPWYPTMRLFRQQHPGDWHTVIENIKKALEHRLQSTSKKTDLLN